MSGDGIKYLGSLRAPVEHSSSVKRDADGNHPSYRPPPKAVTISARIGRQIDSMRSSNQVFKEDLGEGLQQRLIPEGERSVDLDELSNDAYNQILLNSATSMLVQGAPEADTAELLLR